MAQRIALVMAGGGGTRLWPASTSARPKHLLDPRLGAQPGPAIGGTLLTQTIHRLRGFAQPERVWVVTTADQVSALSQVVPRAVRDHIVVEPFGRNTAPCIALSLIELRARLGPSADDATIVVLPADHHIADDEGFRQLLSAAAAHAEAHDAIVTLGIEPDHPSTGYGYMERSDERVAAVEGDSGVGVYRALRFVEKPDLQQARGYVQSGRFLWNAGIFVMPLRRIAQELQRFCPTTWTALEPVAEAWQSGEANAARQATARAYETVVSEPIDVAVMEKQSDLLVIPARVGWTDLGSWRAVHAIADKDASGNAVLTGAHARAEVAETNDSLVWSEDATVAVLGMSDVCVVVSGGGVLVCPRDRAEDIRALVDRINTGPADAKTRGSR